MVGKLPILLLVTSMINSIMSLFYVRFAKKKKKKKYGKEYRWLSD